MDVTYTRPDTEPCCFKMSMYGTCPNGHRGCISHHGRLFINGRIELVGKTGTGDQAKVHIRYPKSEDLVSVTPAEVRALSGAKERRAYMARLMGKAAR